MVGGINLLRRSKDKQIGPDDYHLNVQTLLKTRYRLRRNSVLKVKEVHEPEPSGQKLTVEVGIAPNETVG